MFFGDYEPMLEGQTIADPKNDYRSAQKYGFFRISDQAFYQPNRCYLPRSVIRSAEVSMGSAHVTGCCAGGVYVPRLVIHTDTKKFPILCDNAKLAESIADALNGKN